MQTARKITVQLPEELLEQALKSTGRGITSTIRQGLELVAAGRAFDKLRRLKGKVKLSVNLKRLREDRK